MTFIIITQVTRTCIRLTQYPQSYRTTSMQ